MSWRMERKGRMRRVRRRDRSFAVVDLKLGLLVLLLRFLGLLLALLVSIWVYVLGWREQELSHGRLDGQGRGG